MKLLPLLKLSSTSLRVHKSRALLTMLGIIIGISAVIIISSVGAGAQSLIFNQIKSVGSNLVAIMPGHRSEDEPPAAAFGISITTLSYEDAVSLTDPNNVPHAIAATPYLKGTATLSYRNRTHESSYNGVSFQYPVVEDAKLEQGSFFSIREEKGLERVVILGNVARDELFKKEDPIGKYIRIKNENFKVIGIFQSRGSVAFQNQDDQVFIPITTAQKIMLGVNHVGLIRVKIDASENVQSSMNDVERTLRLRHKIKNPDDDDFFVGSQAMMLDVLGSITDIIRYLLMAIGAISLLVGGIGIMNIMFVSVNERTREIGLRKAIGARKNDILTQFLLEAITLTIAGGVIGITFGAGFSFLVAVIAKSLGYDWDFVVSLVSVSVAVSFCALIGISFGYFPAKKAAVLDPIESLRYE
jgi:putative ABC transport system permease protein